MSKYTFKYKGKTYTIDWDDFKKSPHGAFTKYVRENIDPHYQDGKEWVDYNVKFTARKYIDVDAKAVVSIPKPKDNISESELEELLLSYANQQTDWCLDDLDWEESHYCDEEIEDVEVDSYEEVDYERE